MSEVRCPYHRRGVEDAGDSIVIDHLSCFIGHFEMSPFALLLTPGPGTIPFTHPPAPSPGARSSGWHPGGTVSGSERRDAPIAVPHPKRLTTLSVPLECLSGQRSTRRRGVCNETPGRVTGTAATVMAWCRGVWTSRRLAPRAAPCRSRYLPPADCLTLLMLMASFKNSCQKLT